MKHLYYSTTLCYCQTLSLHEYLSKCSPYDNAKCTKTEQDFRTCDILQTAPHRKEAMGSTYLQIVGHL